MNSSLAHLTKAQCIGWILCTAWYPLLARSGRNVGLFKSWRQLQEGLVLRAIHIWVLWRLFAQPGFFTSIPHLYSACSAHSWLASQCSQRACNAWMSQI